MKESHGKGVATHTDPESCAGAREGTGEALTGARAGWVLSLENERFRGADAVFVSGRQHPAYRYCEIDGNSAWSETPGMHGNTSCENRETPCLPVGDGSTGRVGNPKGASR